MSTARTQNGLAALVRATERPKWYRHPIRWLRWNGPTLHSIDEDASPLWTSRWTKPRKSVRSTFVGFMKRIL